MSINESDTAPTSLQPCPFCGSDAGISAYHEGDDGLDDIWIISCKECPAEMRGRRQENQRFVDMFPDQKESIIAAWNTRKSNLGQG